MRVLSFSPVKQILIQTNRRCRRENVCERWYTMASGVLAGSECRFPSSGKDLGRDNAFDQALGRFLSNRAPVGQRPVFGSRPTIIPPGGFLSITTNTPIV